jgi:predicted small lipoprotein YifL
MMLFRTLLIVALIATALTGCGRRGSLESPAGELETNVVPGSGSASETLDAASPGSQEPEAERTPQPDRPFFLDFLL